MFRALAILLGLMPTVAAAQTWQEPEYARRHVMRYAEADFLRADLLDYPVPIRLNPDIFEVGFAGDPNTIRVHMQENGDYAGQPPYWVGPRNEVTGEFVI